MSNETFEILVEQHSCIRCCETCIDSGADMHPWSLNEEGMATHSYSQGIRPCSVQVDAGFWGHYVHPIVSMKRVFPLSRSWLNSMLMLPVLRKSNRRTSFRFAIDMDQAFGLLYKCANKQQGSMRCHTLRAQLLRRKGPPQLLLPNHIARFGGVECPIQEVFGDLVTLELSVPHISADGILEQTTIAIASGAINEAFRSFWAPIWMRDGYNEPFGDESWGSFLHDLEQIWADGLSTHRNTHWPLKHRALDSSCVATQR